MVGNWLGLGAANRITREAAIKKAKKLLAIIAEGGNPLAEKRARKPTAIPTFAQAADAMWGEYEKGLQNEKVKYQGRRALDFLKTKLGRMSIADITPKDVADTLALIWLKTPETARKTRQKADAVFNWAIAHGHRPAGSNPATTEIMKRLLPKHGKHVTKNMEAMPYAEVPTFMANLLKRGTVPTKMLAMTILCGTRTTETLAAEWTEFDLDKALWTIPASRMKMRKPHTIPLPRTALDILTTLPRNSRYVFGNEQGRPYSNMTMLQIMRRANLPYTVHGFRSSLRDFAAENGVDRQVAEAALAHAVAGVEGHYLRTKFLKHRASLMDAWAGYCIGQQQGETSREKKTSGVDVVDLFFGVRAMGRKIQRYIEAEKPEDK